MKFFSRDLEFFFTGREQKFVQIFCVFVQKIKKMSRRFFGEKVWSFRKRRDISVNVRCGYFCTSSMTLRKFPPHIRQRSASL